MDSIGVIKVKDSGGITAVFLTFPDDTAALEAAFASLQQNCTEHTRWLGSDSTIHKGMNGVSVAFTKPVEDEELLDAVIGAAGHNAQLPLKIMTVQPKKTGSMDAFGALAIGLTGQRSKPHQ